MKNVLCVKWGDKYDGYEEKLKQELELRLSCDFNFYCLTDKPEKDYHIKLPTLWDKHYIPEKNHFWAYRKFYMFNEKLFPRILGQEFLFFDLDVVFHRTLDYFFQLKMDKPWIVRGWWNDIDVCRKNYNKGVSPLINSSVIRWNRGQLLDVYNQVNDNAEYVFFTYKTIDNYLNRVWYNIKKDESKKFNLFEKRKIYSWYKGNVFPMDMQKNLLRKDHLVCLFNNSSDKDDRAIEKVWKQNV